MEIRKGAVTAIVYVQIAGRHHDRDFSDHPCVGGCSGSYEGKNVTLVVNPTDIIIACD